jgi:hypothetical protein
MTEKFASYLFEYTHDGQTWGFEIKASSVEDAQARVESIAHADYLGVIHMRVPVELGIVARLTCWLRNFFN